MRALIIDGTPASADTLLGRYIEGLAGALRSRHAVTIIGLGALNLSRCTGCFGCWVRTPGRCVARDDSHRICAAYIRSDLVIYASPVIRGFTSALLKRAQDKLIPLLHPYFTRISGEIHHRPRYGAYPGIGLLLEKQADTDDDDIDIVTGVYHRLARNFHTRLVGCAVTHMDIAEAARVIAPH